jgi:hypothetical protein
MDLSPKFLAFYEQAVKEKASSARESYDRQGKKYY